MAKIKNRYMVKDRDRKVRYSQQTEELIESLHDAGVGRTFTETMHDAMRLGLKILAERYQIDGNREGSQEGLDHAS